MRKHYFPLIIAVFLFGNPNLTSILAWADEKSNRHIPEMDSKSHEHAPQTPQPAEPVSEDAVDSKVSMPPEGLKTEKAYEGEPSEEAPETEKSEKESKNPKSDEQTPRNEASASNKKDDAKATEKKDTPKPGAKADGKNQYRPKNRLWIIKNQKPDEIPTLKSLQEKLKWKNDRQKAECKAYVDQLKDCFLKTRYYSIQGDSCVTAQYAAACLKLTEQCRKDCPPGFLEAHGYSDRIIRNWGRLKILGKEGCLR